MYLKQSNSLYHDIDVTLDNIPRNLLLLIDYTYDHESDNSNLLEEDDKPLDLHRFNSQEIMFIPNVLGAAERHIALGDGKQLKSKLNDAFCEQLIFHIYFLRGSLDIELQKR